MTHRATIDKTILITVNVHGVGPEAARTPEAALYGREAHGRYAYSDGLSRVLDMLRRQAVHATFFWPVFEAERMGALLERCLKEGHEVASHGNAFEELALQGDAEGELLLRARDRLAAFIGRRPAGFRHTWSSFTPRTVSLLSELGYRYDSSAIDDDAPYRMDDVGGRGMIELPWSEGLCDATYFGARVTQDRARSHLIEQAQGLLEAEGYACLTLHPRADIGVGRAARLLMVEQLLNEWRMGGARYLTCGERAASFSGGV